MKRREFLGRTIAGTAGIALGTSGLLTSSCKGANDKIVLALIGSGYRGQDTVISCCRENENVEVKTVCDVNDLKSARAAEAVTRELGYTPQTTRYMKEVLDDRDIDAVWIATPDHWHALATIWACQAGKDVYVEKCPTHSIWEGRKMTEAAKKYRKIVQVGFQNRSGGYNLAARDFIGSGKLGQVVHIRIYNLLTGKKWLPAPNEEIPSTIDWDAWLGPAPYRPFNQGIVDGWIYYYDFCPGFMDDAVHQLDLTRMVMGDPGHPVAVYGRGGNHVWNSEQETPELQSITFDYGRFTMTCDSGNVTSYMSKTPNDIRMDPERFPEWRTNSCRIEIYGSDAVMFLGRQGGGWQVFGPNAELIAQHGGVHSDKEHQTNFIECVRNRKQPNSTAEQGHMSATLVHMANIACRAGNRHLLFDAEKEIFIDENDANKLVKDSYRDSYVVPEKV